MSLLRSRTAGFCCLVWLTAYPGFAGGRQATGSAATPQDQSTSATAAPAKPAPVYRTIAAGERLQIRMIDAIDSKTNAAGQSFRATLDTPLTSGNRVVAPTGSPVTVLLTNAKSAGRVKGSSELELRVTNIRIRGVSYRVTSSVYEQEGKSRGKQSAVRTGLAAAGGALIGGLAGGGKGAAIGAAAGGGAGIGYQAMTHGPQVKVASESILTFQLSAPLRVRM